MISVVVGGGCSRCSLKLDRALALALFLLDGLGDRLKLPEDFEPEPETDPEYVSPIA